MNTGFFELSRLILIDSLCPDRVIELPLDGGAVLTGRNGRGKTSLLQLLLLFYGESPNRIVTTEAGRDSFVAYYLPRVTSYIVFEYRRPDGLPRMVVAYADRHGEKVFYRFVRHGFEIQQFVTSDNELVRAADLVRHLTANGYQCADWQVETTADYRNIIQGIPSSSTNRQHQQHMRLLMQDYAFTQGRFPLRQIEKIVSGMFRRKTNFDDLQSMVIDCVTDDVNALVISGDRRKIEDWPRDYRAYQAVMAEAAQMDKVVATEQQLELIEAELAQLRARYGSLNCHLEQQYQLQQQAKNQHETELDQQHGQYLQQQEQLNSQRVSFKQEADQLEKRAHKLKQQFDQFAERKMSELDNRVRQAPLLQQNLQSLRARKTILLGEQERISLEYEQLKQQQQESFNLYRDQLLNQQQQLRTQYEQRLEQLEQQAQQQQQLQREQREQQRLSLEQHLQSASEELGRCKAEQQQPRLDPTLSALLEQKQITLDETRKLQQQQDQLLRQREQAYHAARYAFEEQEQLLASACRQQQHAETVLAEKRALLAPEAGSLLFFLKQHAPDWGQDIARVINPALLQSHDLEPSILDNAGSCYGLALNLERLEPHPAAQASSAEQAVQQAEQQLAQLQIAVAAARQKLAELAKQREQTEQTCQQQQRSCDQLRLSQQQALLEVDTVKRQLAEQKQQWQQLAEQQLKHAQQLLQQQQQALKHFDQQTRQQEQQAQQVWQQQRAELQQQRQHELAELEQHLQQRKTTLLLKLQQLDSERDQALQQQGVDTTQLNGLDQEIKHNQQELAAIDSLSPQVEEWRYWLQHAWPEFPELQAQAALARQQEQHWQGELSQLEQAWIQQKNQLETSLKQQRKQLEKISQQQQQLGLALPQLASYTELEIPSYDPSWTLDLLTQQFNQLSNSAEQQKGHIRSLLGNITQKFRLYSGTPPEQYLQNAVAHSSPSADRQWIKPLKRWFDSEHQEYKRLLLMQAASIAGEVQLFHQRLSSFHRRVLVFNRELQQHLDTSLAFDSISEVRVEVVSTLHELKYWSAISQLAEAYADWNAGLSNELPPTEFASNIEQLLEHWEVKAGIRADFINLIRLQGEVTENGHRRIFKRASDLEVISSNGLSYLILATIFVAFIKRIRREAPVQIVWALDELKDLDAGNVIGLMDLLVRNNITLVSAFPDPDPDTLSLFKHAYTIDPDRRLVRVEVQHV